MRWLLPHRRDGIDDLEFLMPWLARSGGPRIAGEGLPLGAALTLAEVAKLENEAGRR